MRYSRNIVGLTEPMASISFLTRYFLNSLNMNVVVFNASESLWVLVSRSKQAIVLFFGLQQVTISVYLNNRNHVVSLVYGATTVFNQRFCGMS